MCLLRFMAKSNLATMSCVRSSCGVFGCRAGGSVFSHVLNVEPKENQSGKCLHTSLPVT